MNIKKVQRFKTAKLLQDISFTRKRETMYYLKKVKTCHWKIVLYNLKGWFGGFLLMQSIRTRSQQEEQGLENGHL